MAKRMRVVEKEEAKKRIQKFKSRTSNYTQIMEFHQKHPLNVETKLSSLTSHFITPTNLLFHRNHDEVPFDSTLRRQDYQDYQLQLSLPSDLKHKLGCIWNWKQESELESKGEQMPQSSSSNNSSSTCDTLNLPLSQLKDSYPQQRLAATLECAGNRRAEFNQNEGTEEDDDLKAEGIEWGPGVLGCCVWQGETPNHITLFMIEI